MSKGILLVATGHPYYGRMALNLCMSIKATEKDMPVAIAHNGAALSHLGEDHFELFDHIIQMADEVPANPQCKLYGDIYSPFDETILLDVDTLWLPFLTPSKLFEQIEQFGLPFAGITEGKESDINPNYFFWADPNEIKRKYKLRGELYQWRSEFMYFSKTGGVVLARAREICKNPGLDSIINFAHNVPDELGINIATAEMGILPFLYKWSPTFWPLQSGGVIPALNELGKTKYLISFGSNRVSGTLRGVHDRILGYSAGKLKRSSAFPMMQKRDFDTQRDKM